MDFQRLYNEYLKNDRDPYNVSIDLLPFISNVSTSKFDGTCSLKGITGEFFRNLKGTNTSISNYTIDAEIKVVSELIRQGTNESTVEKLKLIMKDLMCSDNSFRPIEASFLQFHTLDKKDNGKLTRYGVGQRRIATYLTSMVTDKDYYKDAIYPSNLLSQTIKSALDSIEQPSKENYTQYYILPFIKRQFENDFKWLLKQDDYVIIKYIDLFLYFYVCYSVGQTIMSLDAHNKVGKNLEKPEICYFILSNEPASDKRFVVTQGWSTKFKTRYIEKMYGRMQCLDILNTIAKDNEEEVVGLYSEVLERFYSVPFAENKENCEAALKYYITEKSKILNNRPSETNKNNLDDVIEYNVESYEDFFNKLETACMKLQSHDYQSKFSNQIIDLFKIRLLQQRRGRGQAVLVIDEEMLPFLIALITKEERCKLKDLYNKFAEYGICFDNKTKEQIAIKLQKLNVLERKSDSGEAQYAKVIL